MSHRQLTFRVIIGIAALCVSISSDAMNYYKNNGVLKLSGKADASDLTKLKESLSPDITTVIVAEPTGAAWALSRDLAEIVENAKVTTVLQGWCEGFVCPAMFLAGKERMFSGIARPETMYVSLPISTGNFPPTGEDARRPWSDLTDWWREHTKLGRTELWPRHAPALRSSIVARVEHLKFFHPSAKTSKGSAIECWGEKQDFLNCVPMSDNRDALDAGIITTLDRYVPADKKEITQDIAPPPPSTFAKLEDSPLKVEKLNEKCEATYEEFLRHDSPRAFVVSASGGCYFSSAIVFTPYSSAMGKCQKATKNDCQFYAVDDKVVFAGFKPAP
ncbi:hypothetical protein VVD49_09015 [Uliginosibacterium sp. H3]|uniref:Uncharacterized protein n=1 Tax=Uliginosibacterium silvisoli TaxID=3114758 RepID=A0ABU6K1Q9_9RHOO|nr:hypothetical protein [Uliginosibacterium sp. H3]